MQSNVLILNAKEKNQLTYSLDLDTTGFDVIFRLKKSIENITVPLIEENAVKATEGSTSTGYWDIDLETDPNLAVLKGAFTYEIELNDGINPPVFYGDKPQRCLLQVRLDDN